MSRRVVEKNGILGWKAPVENVRNGIGLGKKMGVQPVLVTIRVIGEEVAIIPIVEVGMKTILFPNGKFTTFGLCLMMKLILIFGRNL